MEIPITAYKIQFGCLDCEKTVPPPYTAVAYNREGYVYIVGICPGCRCKVEYRVNILELMRAGEVFDGFEPTAH